MENGIGFGIGWWRGGKKFITKQIGIWLDCIFFIFYFDHNIQCSMFNACNGRRNEQNKKREKKKNKKNINWCLHFDNWVIQRWQ